MAEPITLLNICNGAAAEVFDRELKTVLGNIADINTDPAKKRRIVLTFELKPFRDRSGAEVSFTCKSAVVPVDAVTASAFIARQDGQLVAFTNDVRQEEMFPAGDVPDVPANVRLLKK